MVSLRLKVVVASDEPHNLPAGGMDELPWVLLVSVIFVSKLINIVYFACLFLGERVYTINL